MIRKKVCMLGPFAVGKTSLVSRFVHSMFSEKYLTTVGVRVDKKTLTIGDQRVTLLIWDLHGDDDFQAVRGSYLLGAAGHLLVADGTRSRTIEQVLALRERLATEMVDAPCAFLLNKSDLEDEWDVDADMLARLSASGVDPQVTSAKTGAGVEGAFHRMATQMLAGSA